jgi:hypothetical protein
MAADLIEIKRFHTIVTFIFSQGKRGKKRKAAAFWYPVFLVLFEPASLLEAFILIAES